MVTDEQVRLLRQKRMNGTVRAEGRRSTQPTSSDKALRGTASPSASSGQAASRLHVLPRQSPQVEHDPDLGQDLLGPVTASRS